MRSTTKRRINSVSSESDSAGGSGDELDKSPKKRVARVLSYEDDVGEDAGGSEGPMDPPSVGKTVSFPAYTNDADSQSSESEDSDSSFIDDNTPPPTPSSKRWSLDSRVEDFEPPDPGLLQCVESSEEEGEDEDDYGRKLSGSQVTSICRLDIDAIDAAIGKELKKVKGKRCNSLEEKIKWVVQKYNESKGVKASKWKYEATPIKKPPKVARRDKKHFKGEKFELMLFVQEVKKRVPLLLDYGMNKISSIIHAVVFHYRGGDEIFAVTIGAGWNVVESYCDFSFSSQVAARILSEKGAVESTKKGLVGTEVQSHKIHKSAQQENPFELLEFCTNYTAEIRPTASIFKLSLFQRDLKPSDDKYQDLETNEDDDVVELDEAGNPKQPTTPAPSQKFPYKPVTNQKVIVNLRSIRIQYRLSGSEILSVLDILTPIARGERTYDIYGKVEVDSSAHVKYLTPVDIVTSKDLNLRLSDLIHDALSDRSADNHKLDEMVNFQLTHKHFSRFANAMDFKLTYKTHPIENPPVEWRERPPTLKEVVLALRSTNLANQAAGTNRRQAFLKCLDNVKLTFSYKTGSKQTVSEKLLNLVDGLFPLKQDRVVYWHVQGRWALVRSVYLLSVHREVIKIIRDSRVGVSQYNLQKSWPSLEEIESQDIEDNGNGDGNGERQQCRYSRRFVDTFVQRLKDFGGEIFIPRDNRGLFDFIRCPPKQKDSSVESPSSSSADKANNNEKLSLYFIIPTLNYEVVDKGIQITNAMLQIRKAANTPDDKKVGGSEIIKEKLRSIWDEMQLHGHENFKQRFCTFEKFQVSLSEATICIGVGKGVNDDDLRRNVPLEKFSHLPELVDCNFIHEILQKEAIRDSSMVDNLQRVFFENPQNDDVLRVCHELVKRLQENEYLTSTGGITAKLLAVTKRRFLAEEGEISVPLRQFLYESIVEDFQAKGFTLLAKLAIIRLERTLHDIGCSPMKTIDII